QVLVVHPHAALKIALVLLDRPGRHIKDVRRKLVHLLAPNIGDVVLGDIIGSQNEGLDVAYIILVLLGHVDACKSVRWGVSDLFKALSVWRENDVADHTVFAVRPSVIINRLD